LYVLLRKSGASKYIDTFAHIDANTLDELSKQIAQNRGYLADMSCIINPKL